MQIIKPSVAIVHTKSAIDIYKSIEDAARNCYRSEDKITDDSYNKFINMIIKNGHHSVLEHENISVMFVFDRGVLAELTRHRIGLAISCESTRYVRYEDPNSFKVIKPCFFREDTQEYQSWLKSMQESEDTYNLLLKLGRSPQEARDVLPLSFACQVRFTANIREWRHILTLRSSHAAHPQMREIIIMTLELFKENYPILFSDILLSH
jgi:thymidylate synthase (FAD)